MSSENINQKNPLAVEKTGRLIARFAIPAIISMLVSSLYNIVDQIFIGQGVGMLGNAATNIAFPISIICTATALFLGIGSASNYNLESGAGRPEKAVQIAGTGLFMLAVCGILIGVVVLAFLDPLLHVFGVTPEILPFARDYTGITAFGIPFLILTTGGNHIIRADRSPSYSMACMLTGAIINTILDPLFIFTFHWGIKGAAAATIIGQIISGILVIYYFAKKCNMALEVSMLRPKAEHVKVIAGLGMASCINQIAMAAVQITMNNTLRYYGAQSMYGADIPLACVGVISKVNMVFMAICIGISQGCQPIWGFNYGAENYGRVRETYRKAFSICMTVGITFFLCFQIFPRQIVSIFGSGSEEYFHFAERYFNIFMFATFLNGIQPMSSGFFTSIGKAKLGIVVSLTRQIIFLLPLILIFPVFMGIDGVMYAGPIADAAAALVAVGFAVRQMKEMRKKECI
ncbi:MAG: MATE family efflux transporter [Dorea sp.]|nr:MATE family efflux transporter [Dorea sp.]